MRYRFHPIFVTHTENIDADAGAKINIFFSVFIIEQSAAAFDNIDRESCIGVGNICVIFLKNVHDRYLPVLSFIHIIKLPMREKRA